MGRKTKRKKPQAPRRRKNAKAWGIVVADSQRRALSSYYSRAYDDVKPATDFRSWRLGTNDGDGFDELVVRLSNEQTVHLETMDSRSMFIDIAGVCFWLFRVDGVWVLKGPETRQGGLTEGFDSSDRTDPERKRVISAIKKRIAALKESRRQARRKR
jgi:hypothetical protein